MMTELATTAGRNPVNDSTSDRPTHDVDTSRLPQTTPLASTSHEDERLASLRSYQILDTAPDPALDALTVAAARALDVPVAAISLLDHDRVWFKSAVGLLALIGEVREIPREQSFVGQTLAQARHGVTSLVVPDASLDARFARLPMVTGPEHLRAYAGAAITGRDGLVLGALSVLSRKPHDFTPEAVQVLIDLAAAAAEILELRRIDVAAGLASRDVLRESHRLRAGIDTSELLVHYQPVVDLPTQRWVGLEALVRWDHPERGLLPPAAFLPLAEASGLIIPLGRQVLVSACEQVARWRREIPNAADLHVAVNVSGRQLNEPDVHDMIADALTRSGLPAHALTLELTETSLADTACEVDIALQRIRALGVRLALDDFGTGYASFSYLQRFQPDVVKIDRCFVAALGRSDRDDLLASTLIDLAQRLGCDIVAEGIETAEQASLLADMGVAHGQGYLYSTPRSAEDVQTVLHHPLLRP
jgi:EAL domain-containing protein (putative c-di-GMP-specific phosphodiesterase class I)